MFPVGFGLGWPDCLGSFCLPFSCKNSNHRQQQQRQYGIVNERGLIVIMNVDGEAQQYEGKEPTVKWHSTMEREGKLSGLPFEAWINLNAGYSVHGADSQQINDLS